MSLLYTPSVNEDFLGLPTECRFSTICLMGQSPQPTHFMEGRSPRYVFWDSLLNRRISWRGVGSRRATLPEHEVLFRYSLLLFWEGADLGVDRREDPAELSDAGAHAAVLPFDPAQRVLQQRALAPEFLQPRPELRLGPARPRWHRSGVRSFVRSRERGGRGRGGRAVAGALGALGQTWLSAVLLVSSERVMFSFAAIAAARARLSSARCSVVCRCAAAARVAAATSACTSSSFRCSAARRAASRRAPSARRSTAASFSSACCSCFCSTLFLPCERDAACPISTG